MSAVKLDPARDLGLSSDPSFSSTPTTNYSDPANSGSTSPSMGGISDISSFTAPSAPVSAVPAPQTTTTTTVTAAVPVQQQMPVMSPVGPETKTEIQTFEVEDSKSGNVLFMLSVLLFCASLGVVIYFALRYFSVL